MLVIQVTHMVLVERLQSDISLLQPTTSLGELLTTCRALPALAVLTTTQFAWKKSSP